MKDQKDIGIGSTFISLGMIEWSAAKADHRVVRECKNAKTNEIGTNWELRIGHDKASSCGASDMLIYHCISFTDKSSTTLGD